MVFLRDVNTVGDHVVEAEVLVTCTDQQLVCGHLWAEAEIVQHRPENYRLATQTKEVRLRNGRRRQENKRGRDVAVVEAEAEIVPSSYPNTFADQDGTVFDDPERMSERNDDFFMRFHVDFTHLLGLNFVLLPS